MEVTSFVKHAILPQLRDKGVHRIECRPMAGNDKVERWLKLIGFRKEAVVAQFGQGREDFYLYAWTAPHGVPS
jgi:RimJ/RimL family protein N-acetyltransferase